MRTAFAIVILVLYVAAINYYIATLGGIPIRYSKLIYNCATGLTVAFLFIDTPVEYLHKQVNKINKVSLSINFIIIIFTHLLIISDPTNMLLLFNGSIFVTTLMIFVSGWQHGYFKTRYENE